MITKEQRAQMEHNSKSVQWVNHYCFDLNVHNTVKINLTDNKMFIESYIGEIRIEIEYCPFCGSSKKDLIATMSNTQIYSAKRGF